MSSSPPGAPDAGDVAAGAGTEAARLFVAVVPPPEVLDRIEELFPAEGLLAAGLRPTPRVQRHVTLRFLGRAPVSAAGAALALLRAPVAEAALAYRPTWLNRGVLCLPVAGLDELAAALDARIGSLGQDAGRRPYRGHLTLARRPGGRRGRSAGGGEGPGRGGRVDIAAAGGGTPPVPGPLAGDRFRVEEVVLVRSTLLRSGAVHDPVMVHRLGVTGTAAGTGR